MTVSSMSFGMREFGEADLGDVRRTRRLVAIADACLAQPDHALPDKLHDPAAYQATLRLFRSPHATHAAVLQPHITRTLDRAEQHTHTVLLVHDTTDLDFSGHRTLAKQMGPIGNGAGRGLLCHNTIAVDANTGEILGLAAQKLHVRVPVGKNESRVAKRERASRESRLWSNALDEIGPASATNRWIHVADRGADSFEFVSRLVHAKERFVVRAQHDRSLVGKTKLFSTVRALAACGGWDLEVSATPTRAARKTWVNVSCVSVVLPPPHNRKGEYLCVPISVNVVRVWESNPPAGVAALEWILLTSEEATELDAARRVVGYYGRRWSVEEFHKGLKTGVGIERLQLESRGSLDVAIGLLSVVAVAIVNLRHMSCGVGTDQESASRIVPRRWVELLSMWRYHDERDLSADDFVKILARLGGWIPRKQPPGWLVLWRGWKRLHNFIELDSATPKM